MTRPTVELSMIVKDGGAALDRCLASVDGVVDRIVVGDTGSSDDSLNIAKRHGAETLSVPWEEDFARARNRVLAEARCDWVLVLDADEMLDREQAQVVLPALMDDPRIHAYGFKRWNYLRPADRIPCRTLANPGLFWAAREYPSYVESTHVRLFRRHPGIFFEHCVHEQVDHVVDALGLRRAVAPLTIHHFGTVETPLEIRRQKVELYQRLGLRKLETRPDDFGACFQLGMSELFHLNLPEEALKRFERAGALRAQDSRAPLYAGICLLRLGRVAEARESLTRAEALGEEDPALYDALGDVFLQTGEYAAALEAFRRLYLFGSVSAIAQAKEGAAEVYLGETEKGLARIRAAVEAAPQSEPLRALYALMEQTAAGRDDAAGRR
jgi:tetratricopeptide (TPR) repeat protein